MARARKTAAERKAEAARERRNVAARERRAAAKRQVERERRAAAKAERQAEAKHEARRERDRERRAAAKAEAERAARATAKAAKAVKAKTPKPSSKLRTAATRTAPVRTRATAAPRAAGAKRGGASKLRKPTRVQLAAWAREPWGSLTTKQQAALRSERAKYAWKRRVNERQAEILADLNSGVRYRLLRGRHALREEGTSKMAVYLRDVLDFDSQQVREAFSVFFAGVST